LAKKLKVTRTTVWKTLQHVSELGIEIQKASGQGYCIPGGIELLDQEKILSELSTTTKKLFNKLEIHQTIDSTNQYLLQQKDVISGTVCLAEKQTAGRGRRGREWISPYAANMYLSVFSEFPEGISKLSGLSLVVGIAIVTALEKLKFKDIQLKWPNDLVYQGKKLGGILIDLSGDVNGPCNAVIGVGLNIKMPPDSAIDQPWIDLQSIASKPVSRNKIIGKVLESLLTHISLFQKHGLKYFLKDWQRLDVLYGQEITLSSLKNPIHGTAKGIDDLGNLLVKIGSVIEPISSGDVSVRIK
ncbi:MAG: bifunctional biotin--[acetyl-CoA-carboxylase] ligase/biotin operon repressor BirA, partial [Proteobacteria bacterium]|nr:bifunctional biotin--[acetyl-CoA-carboxylase] ligase/biotin operon repressor BirA [Pseudomonadota bacterium]